MDLFLLILIAVGLVLYIFTNNKIAEIGRLMFAIALLALVLHGGPHLRLTS